MRAVQNASGPAEAATSNRALNQPTSEDRDMVEGSNTIDTQTLKEHRDLRALEGQICDLVRASRIADKVVETTLGFERARRQNGFLLFRLHEDELADIAFLLGEVAARCSTLDDAFHVSLTREASN